MHETYVTALFSKVTTTGLPRCSGPKRIVGLRTRTRRVQLFSTLICLRWQDMLLLIQKEMALRCSRMAASLCAPRLGPHAPDLQPRVHLWCTTRLHLLTSRIADRREFIKISQAVGMGFLIMGAIGYIIKLSEFHIAALILPHPGQTDHTSLAHVSLVSDRNHVQYTSQSTMY